MKEAEVSVHFKSLSIMWATPWALFSELNQEFNFNIDACAVEGDAKCEQYFSPTPERNGLFERWEGVIWCNPPYGRGIGKWVSKGYSESLRGSTVVMLLPSRTDTRWWHDFVMKGEIRFIRGRLRFGDSKNPAPFPSAIVVFHPQRLP